MEKELFFMNLIGVVVYFFLFSALLSITLCVFLKYKKAAIVAASVLLVEALVLTGLNLMTYRTTGYDVMSCHLNENYCPSPFLKGPKKALKETGLELPHIASIESFVGTEGNNMATVDNRYMNHWNTVYYDVTFKQPFSEELVAHLERLSENDGHWSKEASFWDYDYYDYSDDVECEDWCITHVEIYPNDNMACVIHYIQNGYAHRGIIGTPDLPILFKWNVVICAVILLLRGLYLMMKYKSLNR